MLLKIDQRQLDHLLAALRLLQAHAMDGYHEEHNFEGIIDLKTAMSSDEIETLCQAINGGTAVVDEKDLAPIVKQWTDRAHHQGYSPKKRQQLQGDFFAGAMAARHQAGMENWCPGSWYIAILRGDAIG